MSDAAAHGGEAQAAPRRDAEVPAFPSPPQDPVGTAADANGLYEGWGHPTHLADRRANGKHAEHQVGEQCPEDMDATATAQPAALAHLEPSLDYPAQHDPGASTSQQPQPPPQNRQPGARLRHCTSLRSVADADHAQLKPQEGRGGQHTTQRAQHEAERLNAQQHEAASLVAQQPGLQPGPMADVLHAQYEACVASSRRLEQPTASTGTSRPVALAHPGLSSATPCPVTALHCTQVL